MMDIAKTYFEYRLVGGCGIPRIDMLGTADDWQRLLEKIQYLKRFAVEGDPDGFGAWVQSLETIGGKFLEAVSGSPDRAFFGSVLNEAEGSGQIGQPITGWISFLFLYNKDGRPIYSRGAWNAYARAKSLGGPDSSLKWAKESQGCDSYDRKVDWGMSLEDFPHGMAKAPINMEWLDVGIDELLLAVAGTTTVHQHADGALEARTGWAILRKPDGDARRGVRGGLMAPRTAADFWGDVA